MTTPYKTHITVLMSLFILSFGLSGCSSLKKEMGVGRYSPDEFTVIKRAPLTLPPDYNLRPPTDPSEESAGKETINTAKEILFGEEQVSLEKTEQEKNLLHKIGADTANQNIRKQIDEDNGFIALSNKSVTDKLIYWKDEKSVFEEIPVSVVNPTEEAARIKKNQEEGKPLHEGDVPVIEKKKSALDKIF